jgi:hypothetical protein
MYAREVTLVSVMDEYRNIFESLHPNKSKAHPKGSDILVATPPPKGKRFAKQCKKGCILCGKQGHKSVECYSRSENAHKEQGFKANEKAHITTTPTPARTPSPARKLDIQRSSVSRSKMRKENEMMKLVLCLWSLNMVITLSRTTLILLFQDLPATCAVPLRAYLISIHISLT